MDFNDWLDENYGTSVRDIVDANLDSIWNFKEAIAPLLREFCECCDVDPEEEQFFIWVILGVYDEQLRAHYEEE